MKKIIAAVLSICILASFMLTSCSPFDPTYGTSGEETSKNNYENVKIPEIKSDDEKMPTFFDISLFDEENYSDIYLGKKFEYKVTYAGTELEVPCDLDDMEDLGYTFADGESMNGDSQIRAAKSAKVNLKNQYNKQITAVFYNSSKSIKKLSKCDIVKFIIPENDYINTESVYGQFCVNGVSNESAITDIVEFLGAPSHFYAVSDTKYYFDYFISPKDKRSGITVYVDLESDCVTAIEFSLYD